MAHMNAIYIILILVALGLYYAFRFNSLRSRKQATNSQARLKRIRHAARFFKWICCAAFGFIVFVAAIAVFLPGVVVKDIHPNQAMSISGPIVMGDFKPEYAWFYRVFWLLLAGYACWGVSFFYRLLRNLEQGVLFGSDNVRCLRNIGLWTAASPLLGVGFQLSKLIWAIDSPLMIDLSPMFNGFLEGFFIIFIAWIMDEGRKIQEEQELTV
jgi:hypothetical protein